MDNDFGNTTRLIGQLRAESAAAAQAFAPIVPALDGQQSGDRTPGPSQIGVDDAT